MSHSFGYGLMDAAAMVRLARVWSTVAPQQFCEVRAPDMNKYFFKICSDYFKARQELITRVLFLVFCLKKKMFRLIPAKSQIKIQLTVQECAGVNFMEHLQVLKVEIELKKWTSLK